MVDGTTTNPAPPSSERPGPGPASMVEIALCFALVTAAVHLAFLLFRTLVLGRVASTGIHLLWITPASYTLLCGGIVWGGALAAMVWPHPFIRSATFFALAATSVFSVLLLVKQIHPYASLALAVGIAARWARASREMTAPRRWLRTTNVVLVTLVGLGTLAAWIAPPLRESLIERRLPPAAPNAPNVLLIVLDTVRARNLGLYGYARPTTPHLERWAREGTIFDYAIAPAPWTLPTHASLFTGMPPTLLSARFTQRLDDAARLPEVLQRRGYVTAGFSGNNAYGTSEAGLARGFQFYLSHRSTPGDILRVAMPLQTALWKSVVTSRSPRRMLRALRRFDLRTPYITRGEPHLTATELRTRAVSWLDQHRGRPFFMFVNFFDAHTQERPPRPDQIRRFADSPQPIDRYDSAIAYADEEVEALMSALRSRGLLDRTIVALTSDHGEHHGERGLREHANSLYLDLLHVPLVIRYPGAVPAGSRVSTPVSLVDLPATLLALAGAGGALPGRPLLGAAHDGVASGPVLSDVERAVAMTVPGPTQRGAMRSLVDAQWHYIRNGDGIEELYAYRVDPEERRNLADTPGHAAVLESMRTALAGMPRGYETDHDE